MSLMWITVGREKSKILRGKNYKNICPSVYVETTSSTVTIVKTGPTNLTNYSRKHASKSQNFEKQENQLFVFSSALITASGFPPTSLIPLLSTLEDL